MGHGRQEGSGLCRQGTVEEDCRGGLSRTVEEDCRKGLSGGSAERLPSVCQASVKGLSRTVEGCRERSVSARGEVADILAQQEGRQSKAPAISEERDRVEDGSQRHGAGAGAGPGPGPGPEPHGF